MKTKEIRQELIANFGKLIQDDSKLAVLEGVFDAILNDEKASLVSDIHYQKVEEARAEYHSGNSFATSWEDLEKQLNAKYGF
ncbi:hypothetical protein [Flavobacterium gawalongense]|uniref:Addiction module protein n=1 Tax=Flavobacterium gawalongense TaxID=2594432 RepID=A0ABY3CPS9_9FLAO|nr:hypothetical protein [Flavobacterium gawalongense]TRX03190.1 hypothetical protein FNW33_04995 [Flavobacterium gawalongense]TRX09852.1 hypothetical protein FNW12_01685 [Flavobacterium gawalongense]